MRFTFIALILSSLLTTSAAAAPFILCELPDLETYVSFDIGMQRFQLEDDGWLDAKVLVNEYIIFGTWEFGGRFVGVNFEYQTDQSTFKWTSPTLSEPAYGTALCDYYAKE